MNSRAIGINQSHLTLTLVRCGRDEVAGFQASLLGCGQSRTEKTEIVVSV